MTPEMFEWCRFFIGEGGPLNRLGASILVNHLNPESALMAMFTAYFDASGNGRDQPFVLVSGYVANFAQWKAFERTWKLAHDEYGVSLPFHMAEFMAAHTNPRYRLQKNARQDYVSISSDPARAEKFFEALMIAQIVCVNCAFSCIVPMNVYNEVSSLLDLREIVPPYALAARTCIVELHKWEKYFHIEEPVECIFEEGDFEQGKFTNLMIDEGMEHPIYRSKNKFAGLQAADHYLIGKTGFVFGQDKIRLLGKE